MVLPAIPREHMMVVKQWEQVSLLNTCQNSYQKPNKIR
jgi:hypothetical protein